MKDGTASQWRQVKYYAQRQCLSLPEHPDWKKGQLPPQEVEGIIDGGTLRAVFGKIERADAAERIARELLRRGGPAQDLRDLGAGVELPQGVLVQAVAEHLRTPEGEDILQRLETGIVIPLLGWSKIEAACTAYRDLVEGRWWYKYIELATKHWRSDSLLDLCPLWSFSPRALGPRAA